MSYDSTMEIEVLDEKLYGKLKEELEIPEPAYGDDVLVIARFKDGRTDQFYAFIEDVALYVCGDYLCLTDEYGNKDPSKKVAKVTKWW